MFTQEMDISFIIHFHFIYFIQMNKNIFFLLMGAWILKQ